MRLNELPKIVAFSRARKRKGKGVGSGNGKTAGRGHKGGKARSGYSPAPCCCGVPFYRHLPIRGFSNYRFRTEYEIVDLQKLIADTQARGGFDQEQAMRSAYEAYIKAGEKNLATVYDGIELQKGLESYEDFTTAIESATETSKWIPIGEAIAQGFMNAYNKDKTNDITGTYMLVQCSLFEGKSIVLDEAKILGIPIIATEYPTVRDQVTENKEGLIVPITPEGLADGIEKMIRDAALRESIAKYLLEKDYGNTAELKKIYNKLEIVMVI